MSYPVCGMVHLKDPFLLIEKSRPKVATAGFLSYNICGH